MQPDIDSTVTIERRFFETLQPSDVPVSRSLPNDALIVSRADHEALQRMARRYSNLCQNLLRGGVVEDTINLLSQDEVTNSIQDDAFTSPPQSVPQKEHRTFAAYDDNALPHVPPRLRPVHAGRKPLVEVGDGHNKPPAGPAVHSTVSFEGSPDWADADGGQDALSYSAETPDDADIHGQQLYPAHSEKPAYEKQCMRTIQLIGLPDGTTHADITGVVRGGLLLDIFIRAHDRSATVSFLHSADARIFFEHCRRHDLYIRQKRIEVRWSDRQFTLSGHVASKIGNGATRNLVLRRYDSDTTEASIREDLDHIHNLAVVKVTFIGGSCFISLNSVHNCIVAKTCMMSRLKYKNCKIEWDVDECAQPLDRVQLVNTRKDPPPAKRHVNTVANRFKLLSMDGEDEDPSEQNYAAAKGSIGVVA
ncbi:uncharacterized protein PpBr36_06001 [Pyricularia pennisetigena]|uniref:uncharacterized protein n=1 Tax=Pyricularia pennisetigena TaxID=1578925 RepID=UPI001150F747|nr:uncharacterized protein PpBr36_06001 [Pyricularia pennisetigena]TLS22649.1 hypothetical protein PpBr36_06001 [Pyricularia pennisetigena]